MVIGQGIASIVAIVAQYLGLFTGDNARAGFFFSQSSSGTSSNSS